MEKKHCKGFDLGPGPVIIHMPYQSYKNKNYRTAVWTGDNLQMTLMNIGRDGEIGVEMHDDVDQLIRIECGSAKVFMGSCRKDMKFVSNVSCGDAILVPAGTWHNIVNASCRELKLSSVYAPPQHPFGTVHETKEDSDKEHHY
ncbi:MAG: cupin domain-containing protein [Oscillospiraceae bacterium]|nr:cupin domain-containing protein [Oscillospiraceae bacterium]